MIIHSTQRTPHRVPQNQTAPLPKEAPAQEAQDSFQSSQGWGETGSALAGGLTLGAGGALLGFHLGMDHAFSAIPNGNPLLTSLGILVALPVGIAYGVAGAAAGGAIGAAAGTAAGIGIHAAVTK